MRKINSSELIINSDGTIFHLHLRPEQIADIVILVGDRGRVGMVASHFDEVECDVENREFHTITGRYRGRRMSVLSTGIGIGNIDICVTELDALANIDFESREERSEFTKLTLLRLGTSGAVQEDLVVGDQIFARTSLGFDGLLNYYAGAESVCDEKLEEAFMSHLQWSDRLPRVYAASSSDRLWELFRESSVKEGITIASPGFYAPQGRYVRLKPADESMNQKIESFEMNGRRVTNYEMESSALAGMATLMGHDAATICTIIAQRVTKEACTDYKPFVESMVKLALDRLATL